MEGSSHASSNSENNLGETPSVHAEQIASSMSRVYNLYDRTFSSSFLCFNLFMQ